MPYEWQDYMRTVALLAEGVDRNLHHAALPQALNGVALLAEGVDRNSHASVMISGSMRSPSSRRAWIEIGAKY